MTSTITASSRPIEPDTIVWESSAILHACRSDRADVLLHLADALSSTPIRHVTTAAVAEELHRRHVTLPARLDVDHVDGIDELAALVRWVQRLSSSEHDRGEATVCAWAEAHDALAVIDDRAARIAAQRAGLDVHGTAWVIAQAVNLGRETPSGATALLDTLILDGARYPFRAGGFATWAKAEGLLVAA
jgi:predicted nucleic acid-binding protein